MYSCVSGEGQVAGRQAQSVMQLRTSLNAGKLSLAEEEEPDPWRRLITS
jgi:hypothetical protein